MRVDLFDFHLPSERIALAPASPRDAARMLVVAPDGALEDRVVGELPDFLRPGDALVVNDTRVIAARLGGIRARGEGVAEIEATLIKRLDAGRWRALVRPAKRLKVGERIRFGEASESSACLLGALDAEVEAKGEAGEVTLCFAFHGAALDEAIERIGAPPLPPYIASRRALRPSDRANYQTVFAREDGAVAAPTAGLHFTPALLSRVEAAGASVHRLTLHVGAGTFLPVKADDTRDHAMHAEWGRVDAATAQALNAARARGGRIVAVGTTSARLIESAADQAGAIRPFASETAIFITPGYRFRAVDALLTNFHLPRSTLFMLVAAFSGLETMRDAYAHAIATGYRFYSYGDACLLLGADRSRAGLGLGERSGRGRLRL
ncbi:MAG: tRNA preQ1(34) S-adenosylmethionine ribosyltransferase-isomerase QueA [Roseiarcus sp.]|jgi:S-adenosylmethionine:tRNA ribosyltransferase-isomerase